MINFVVKKDNIKIDVVSFEVLHACNLPDWAKGKQRAVLERILSPQ